MDVPETRYKGQVRDPGGLEGVAAGTATGALSLALGDSLTAADLSSTFDG